MFRTWLPEEGVNSKLFWREFSKLLVRPSKIYVTRKCPGSHRLSSLLCCTSNTAVRMISLEHRYQPITSWPKPYGSSTYLFDELYLPQPSTGNPFEKEAGWTTTNQSPWPKERPARCLLSPWLLVTLTGHGRCRPKFVLFSASCYYFLLHLKKMYIVKWSL